MLPLRFIEHWFRSLHWHVIDPLTDENPSRSRTPCTLRWREVSRSVGSVECCEDRL